MTDLCHPPIELRGESGWHWLALYGHTRLAPYLWNAHYQGWDSLGATVQPPDAAYAYGYRYIAPAILPDDWVTWRPIETAPRDESAVLLADTDCLMEIGWWHRGAWRHGPKGYKIAPTHWMPIPAPPTGPTP
jgi:hypothetical protein